MASFDSSGSELFGRRMVALTPDCFSHYAWCGWDSATYPISVVGVPWAFNSTAIAQLTRIPGSSVADYINGKRGLFR
jgi:hypothetical protein